MIYNTKIRNKNLAGMSVCGHPFKTLRGAETYCNVHDIDPNAISDDPYDCLNAVNAAMPELEYIREMLSNEIEEVRRNIDITAKQIDNIETPHNIFDEVNLSVAKDEHRRLCGMLSALVDFSGKLCDRACEFRFLRSMRRT